MFHLDIMFCCIVNMGNCLLGDLVVLLDTAHPAVAAIVQEKFDEAEHLLNEGNLFSIEVSTYCH